MTASHAAISCQLVCAQTNDILFNCLDRTNPRLGMDCATQWKKAKQSCWHRGHSTPVGFPEYWPSDGSLAYRPPSYTNKVTANNNPHCKIKQIWLNFSFFSPLLVKCNDDPTEKQAPHLVLSKALWKRLKLVQFCMLGKWMIRKCTLGCKIVNLWKVTLVGDLQCGCCRLLSRVNWV